MGMSLKRKHLQVPDWRMDFYKSSGILAKVPGDLIAQGSQSLQRPSAGLPPQALVVEVPDVGRVRIDYVIAVSSHHKSRNWYWSANFAELVE